MAYPYCSITDLKMFASLFFYTPSGTPLLLKGSWFKVTMFFHNDHQLVLKIRDDMHQYTTQHLFCCWCNFIINLYFVVQNYFQSIFCCTRIIFQERRYHMTILNLKSSQILKCHTSTISLTIWTQWKLVHFTGHDSISYHNNFL